eukprot:g37074.t1
MDRLPEGPERQRSSDGDIVRICVGENDGTACPAVKIARRPVQSSFPNSLDGIRQHSDLITSEQSTKVGNTRLLFLQSPVNLFPFADLILIHFWEGRLNPLPAALHAAYPRYAGAAFELMKGYVGPAANCVECDISFEEECHIEAAMVSESDTEGLQTAVTRQRTQMASPARNCWGQRPGTLDIGKQIERWNSLKQHLQLKSDEEMARALLDMYTKTHSIPLSPITTISTLVKE